jgi:hypothetical protein
VITGSSSYWNNAKSLVSTAASMTTVTGPKLPAGDDVIADVLQTIVSEVRLLTKNKFIVWLRSHQITASAAGQPASSATGAVVLAADKLTNYTQSRNGNRQPMKRVDKEKMTRHINRLG